MTDASIFPSVLDKYSRYLRNDGDRDRLLQLGERLFGRQRPESSERPSLSILQAKEVELRAPPPKEIRLVKPVPTRPLISRAEAQMIPPDQLAEEVLVLQDRNAVLLSRCKAVEHQNKAINSEYGCLIEKSVHQKVRQRLETKQLTDELVDALAQSRPGSEDREFSLSSRVGPGDTTVMRELGELNNAVLERIVSFKIAVDTDPSACQQAVMRRYKPQMEKLLGKIYSYHDYLPVSMVLEQFNSASESTDQEIKDMEIQIRSEHEQNDVLQREAKQLADELAAQQKEVDHFRKQNQSRRKSHVLIKEIGNDEIKARKMEYRQLLEITSNEGATPTSARAMIVTTGKEVRKLRRTPSGTKFVRKDAAMPQVKPIEEFIADHRSWLYQKIIQLQTLATS